MFQYASAVPNTMGAAPVFAPMPQARMGMIPFHDVVGAGYRSYDIVGQTTADKSTWEKVKEWGDKPTMGVKNKYLVLGAVVIGTAWYGYYAGWFGK